MHTSVEGDIGDIPERRNKAAVYLPPPPCMCKIGSKYLLFE